MIFLRLDECVSHRIADAAKALGIPQSLKFESPHALGEKGLKDVPWMARFAKRGRAADRRVVFSSDGRMKSNEVERAAAEAAGLVVFYAPRFSFWRHLHSRGQAAYFIRWLDKMVSTAEAANPGDQYQMPSTFNVKAQIKLLPSVLRAQPRRPGRPRKPPASGSLI